MASGCSAEIAVRRLMISAFRPRRGRSDVLVRILLRPWHCLPVALRKQAGDQQFLLQLRRSGSAIRGEPHTNMSTSWIHVCWQHEPWRHREPVCMKEVHVHVTNCGVFAADVGQRTTDPPIAHRPTTLLKAHRQIQLHRKGSRHQVWRSPSKTFGCRGFCT